MKRFLPALAICALTAAPASAQWPSDPKESVYASGIHDENWGYEVATNQNKYTYVFQQVPGSIVTDSYYVEDSKGEDSLVVEKALVPKMYLQIVDPDGRLTQGDTGLLLSEEMNTTYTMVQDKQMIVDRDGNALIAVYDYRTGNPAYTVYKVSQSGEILWNHTLGSGDNGFCYNFTMAQTTDGNYVCAYSTYSSNSASSSSQPDAIAMYKLNADGTEAWSKVLTDPEATDVYQSPSLHDTGDGNVMLVYAQGSNMDIVARCYDAQGNEAWDEPTYIYSAGFGSGMPLHTMLKVNDGPNGGVIVSWHNPDYNAGDVYENRINYILPDGSYRMVAGENGVCVSNDTQYTRTYADVTYNDDEQAIYCIYRQYDQGKQSYLGIFMQKVSYDGEVLWGANGKALVDMQDEVVYNYGVMQMADNGRIAAFYLYQTGGSSYSDPVHAVMVLLDKDGNVVQDAVEIGTSATLKGNLQVSSLIDNQYYIVSWDEGMNNEAVCLQRVYLNGSVNAIEHVSKDEAKQLMRQEVYTADGKQLSAPAKGLNIVRRVYSDNTVESHKVVK